MKIKKLALICMTALLFVIGIPKTAFAAIVTYSCGDNATYTYDDVKKELVISGKGKITERSWKDINAEEVQSVVIQEGITESGWYTFEDFLSLTSVRFPYSMTIIGDYAFDGCKSLKEVTIPKTVTEAQYVFRDTAIERVTFEEGMTVIPGSIFAGCETLKTINFPQTVKKIEGSAFEECEGLTEVTLPWYLEEIGFYTFKDCSNLKKVTMYQRVKTINTYAFKNLKGLTVYGKKGTTAQKFAKANNYTFKTCKIPALKGITYKKGSLKYKVVKDYANNKGTVMVTGLSKKNLSSVTIPDKVKLESYNYKVVKIDKKAFYKQSKLKKITIKAKSITSMGKNAFSKINSKATVYVPKQKYSKYKSLLKKAGLSKKITIKKK